MNLLNKKCKLFMLLKLVIFGMFMPFIDNREVMAQQHYIIATDTTFAPFEFQNANGEYVGIDMDLLDAIAKDQGFTYELRVLGFNAALQALESGQVDGVIAGMSITEERRKVFDFSQPYYSSGVSFVVKAQSEIVSVEELKGKKIAVKNGTTGAMIAESMAKELDFTVVTFEDSANMYEDIIAGNSDAAIEDYAVVSYAINQGTLDLKVVGEQYSVSDFGFAVQKGENKELLEAFNNGLVNLKSSGEYDKIIGTYVGEDATTTIETGIISLIKQNWQSLLLGLLTTLWTTFIAILIALVVGILLGLMRVGGSVIMSTVASVYVDIMRGLPLIVLAFFIYFGIPQLTGLRFTAPVAGIITLSLNAAAYIAEIVRGGIQAVDYGQMEASRSLGLPHGKAMRQIILPQAIKIMIPSFINQFVITLKDTSILSVIGLVELTQSGRGIIARTYQSGIIWLMVGMIYLIVITALTKLSSHLEGGR